MRPLRTALVAGFALALSATSVFPQSFSGATLSLGNSYSGAGAIIVGPGSVLGADTILNATPVNVSSGTLNFSPGGTLTIGPIQQGGSGITIIGNLPTLGNLPIITGSLTLVTGSAPLFTANPPIIISGTLPIITGSIPFFPIPPIITGTLPIITGTIPIIIDPLPPILPPIHLPLPRSIGGVSLSVSTSGFAFTPTIGNLIPLPAINGVRSNLIPVDPLPQGFNASAALINTTGNPIPFQFPTAAAAQLHFVFRVYDSNNNLVWDSSAGWDTTPAVTAVTLAKGKAWRASVFVPLFIDGQPLAPGTYTLDVVLDGAPEFSATTSFVVNPPIEIN